MVKRDEDTVRATMRRVKSRNTSPELRLRKALFKKGLRYRLHAAHLPGKPDIVFVAARVALFVDGDFWHGNQWRLRKKKSLRDQLQGVNNQKYWEEKIVRNRERDHKNNRLLRRAGWRVIRIWESDINKRLDAMVARVMREVNGAV